jgi:hypothetical protein
MPTQPKLEPEGIREQLVEVRNALLSLHKALVDSERVGYERTVGAIPSPNRFFQLLTSDPWFTWLHPLSQLIVSMDELLDAKEPLAAAGVRALMSETGRLLVASENNTGFSGHYFEALQRDPNVVLTHADVAKLISPRK